MIWTDLADQLFGGAHDIQADGDFLSGTAQLGQHIVAIVGTTHHAPIGFALALSLIHI